MTPIFSKWYTLVVFQFFIIHTLTSVASFNVIGNVIISNSEHKHCRRINGSTDHTECLIWMSNGPVFLSSFKQANRRCYFYVGTYVVICRGQLISTAASSRKLWSACPTECITWKLNGSLSSPRSQYVAFVTFIVVLIETLPGHMRNMCSVIG